MRKITATLCVGLLAASPGRPCTIFVLTDGDQVLFFNNEDWFNRNTRLWFVPAGKDHLGCAYIGFDDGWAQGGLNAAGLAFDWVSGIEEKYEPAAGLQPVRGNPSERMLESCTTVDEAVAFYHKFLEPDFRRSRMLIADRTGVSVVIGAREGRLHVARRTDSRGFGWGRVALERELKKSPAPTVGNGTAILRACLQPGDGGTKYSNVFDLKSGTISLFPHPDRDESVTLDLAAELARGGHYYDVPQIREQVTVAPQPLLANMRRFFLDEFQPLVEQEPAIIARLEAVIRDARAGRMEQAHYAPALWEQLVSVQKDIQADMQRLGELRSLVLVEKRLESGQRNYRCLVDFEHARVLGFYALNEHDRVTAIRSEFAETRSSAGTAASN
jgi:hypothetical protein